MRQFVSSAMPDSNGCIALNPKEYRYLSRVLRLTEGAVLDVRLADGSFVPMSFCAEKQSPVLCPCAVLPQKAYDRADRQSETAFWLFQFLPKAHKMDLIVRQATECGVSRIVPVCGLYSPPYQPRIERWRRIVREARQQSGSPVATSVTESMSPEQAAELWKKTAENRHVCAFMLCENNEENQKDLFTHIQNGAVCASDTAIAVGCEGGMSPAEKNLLEQSGFMPIHFKTNILRSETAALYGLAAIQSALTEYEAWKSKE